jgi:predicted nucleic acid-binding Zn ribbon protein
MTRPRRKPLKAPESVEAILGRAGESRFARVRPPIASAVWREAVGARIAERARPATLYGGILVLQVANSVWAHELSLLSDAVCERLRALGVQVKELRFRVTSMGVVDRPAERRISRAVPKALPVPAEVSRSLGQVADDELRATIAAAAAANLAWQAMVQPAPPQQISEARRAARDPRDAAAGTAPPAPGTTGARAGAPRTRGDGPGRSR